MSGVVAARPVAARRAAVLGAGLVWLLSARPTVAAQCPDGTPPPCARAARAAAGPAPNSVAVLYFDNRSRDTADAYLAEQLTEEIIIRLQRLPRLEVKSRFESQRVRDVRDARPGALGRTLGVRWLVSGTVQRAGARILARVELTRADRGVGVWSDRFDRSSGEVLDVIDDIARGVATGVAGQLLPSEAARLAARPAVDPVAYDLYLRGRAAFNRWRDEEAPLLEAVRLYRQAVARDSAFALAWAALADAETWRVDNFVSPSEGYPRVRAAVDRALALDSNLAQAHAVRFWPLVHARDWDGAEAAVRRAIALDPNVIEAHRNLGFLLNSQGRFRESLEELRLTWMLDSTGVLHNTLLAMALAHAGLPDAALALTKAHRWSRGFAHFMAGRLDSAAVELRDSDVPLRALVLMRLGRTEEARAVAERIRVRTDSIRSQGRFAQWDVVATAYAAVGDRDRAFDYLERADGEGSTGNLLSLAVLPEFESLRSDPRYAALLRRLRLAAPR